MRRAAAVWAGADLAFFDWFHVQHLEMKKQNSPNCCYCSYFDGRLVELFDQIKKSANSPASASLLFELATSTAALLKESESS